MLGPSLRIRKKLEYSPWGLHPLMAKIDSPCWRAGYDYNLQYRDVFAATRLASSCIQHRAKNTGENSQCECFEQVNSTACASYTFFWYCAVVSIIRKPSRFQTKWDLNQPAQQQSLARKLKFGLKQVNKWITKVIWLRRCARWSAPLLFVNPRKLVFARQGPYTNWSCGYYPCCLLQCFQRISTKAVIYKFIISIWSLVCLASDITQFCTTVQIFKSASFSLCYI